MHSLSNEGIERLAALFGTVKARLHWSKMFSDFLREYDGPPFKTEGIKYILRSNAADVEMTRYLIQILIHEHPWVLHNNRQQIDDIVGSAGLSISKEGVVKYSSARVSILGAGPMINALSQKIIVSTRPELLRLFSYHMTKAVEHYHAASWDDVVSQLRKALETLLKDVSLWLSEINNQEIPSKNKIPNIKERAAFVTKELFNEIFGGVIYEVYRVLSEKGAHPGISSPEEAVFKKELAIVSMSQIIKRLP